MGSILPKYMTIPTSSSKSVYRFDRLEITDTIKFNYRLNKFGNNSFIVLDLIYKIPRDVIQDFTDVCETDGNIRATFTRVDNYYTVHFVNNIEPSSGHSSAHKSMTDEIDLSINITRNEICFICTDDDGLRYRSHVMYTTIPPVFWTGKVFVKITISNDTETDVVFIDAVSNGTCTILTT